MTKSDKLLTALVTAVIGILFLILKGNVISIAMTVLGVILIASAIPDLIRRLYVLSAVKAVLGILVIVFGWTLASAVLYIFAALLLVDGILQLAFLIKRRVKGFSALDTFFRYADPVLTVIIAFFLLFNQGGTIDWIFIVAGIALVIEAIIALINCLFIKRNEKSEDKKKEPIDI